MMSLSVSRATLQVLAAVKPGRMTAGAHPFILPHAKPAGARWPPAALVPDGARLSSARSAVESAVREAPSKVRERSLSHRVKANPGTV